jgi:hypothetical protein
MNLTCPHCGHQQEVSASQPGQGVQCASCFKIFVPLPNPAPPPIPPPPPGPASPPCFVPVNKDMEHLRLLRIFHFVAAGLWGFGSCFGLIYVVMGILFANSPDMFEGHGQAPPPFMGWIFLVLGLAIVLVGWTVATLMLFAGKFLGRRAHYTFCFTMAAIICIFVPTGTVLGVFTIIVLSRQSVKELFNGHHESVERGA